MEHGERLFDLSLRGGLSKKKEGGDQRKDAGGKIFMKEGRVGKPQKDLGQRAKKKKVAVDSKDVAEQRVEDIKEEDSVTIVTKARNGVIEWENGVVASKGQAINDRAEKEKHKAAHTEEETKKRKKEGNEWWGGEVGQEPLIGAVDGGIILPETSGIDISDGDWGSDADMDSSAESDTKKDKKEDDDEYGLMENFAAENANCSDTSSGPSGAEVEPEQDALSSSESWGFQGLDQEAMIEKVLRKPCRGEKEFWEEINATEILQTKTEAEFEQQWTEEQKIKKELMQSGRIQMPVAPQQPTSASLPMAEKGDEKEGKGGDGKKKKKKRF